MSHIVQPHQRTEEDQNTSRIAVDAEILRKLIVSALHKGTVDAPDRLSAPLGNAGDKGNSMFFANADIHELPSGLCALVGCETHDRRSACGDTHDRGILFHGTQQAVGRDIVVVRSRAEVDPAPAGLQFERIAPVPRLLILFRRSIALALQCIDMDNDRMISVFHLPECGYQRLDIVTGVDIQIIQPHGPE